MPEEVRWGTVVIPCEQVVTTMKQQDAPPIRQGSGGRADRQGVRQLYIDTLEGGMGVIRGKETSKDLTRYRANEGLIAQIPHGLFLPYVAQQDTKAQDLQSGFTSANYRLHALNSTLGQSKLRFHVFIGLALYRNTSDSDASIAQVATSGLSTTLGVTAAAELKANSTRYVAFAADKVRGTTDPTASPPTWADIVNLSANDWVGAIVPLPTLGPGFNIFYGKIAGVSGIFYTKQTDALLTAPLQVALAPTAQARGSIATQTAGSLSAAAGETSQLFAVASASGTIPWANPANAQTDNASYANAPLAGANVLSHLLQAVWDFKSSIPAGAFIEGIQARIQNQDGGSTAAVFDYLVEILAGGKVSLNLASANSWSGGDTNFDYGSTTNRWGLYLRGSDVWDIALRLQAKTNASGTAASDAKVDVIRILITYRLGGTPAVLPLGGYYGCADPMDPFTHYIIAPEYQDDTTTVNVPRILWKCEFSYDSENDRPLVELSKVRTGLTHVSQVVQALGGIVVAGDSSASRAKTLKLVRRDGTIVDLGFGSTAQGFTEDWGIINLWSADRVLIFDVVLVDISVIQTWIYFDGAFHPIGTRETGVTIAPLLYAGAAGISLEPALRRRYRVRPSGTNVVFTRTFQPRNLLQDPLRNDTSEVKADGVLTVTLPELDAFGPEESDKAALKATCLSRDVSSTNTIRLRYSIDGGSSFTTWGTFTAFMQKVTLSPPVALRTLVIEIGLNHTASSAGTPNGLPILLEAVGKWGPLRRWIVDVDPGSAAFKGKYPLRGMAQLWDDLATLQGTLAVQTLQFAAVSQMASWEDFQTAEKPRFELGKAGEPVSGNHRVVFEEVPS